MMNPETNKFEEVYLKDKEYEQEIKSVFKEHESRFSKLSKYDAVELVRSNGSLVPKGYPIFGVGEEFELRGYRFKVKLIKEDELVLEPVGPVPVSKMRSGVYIKKGTGSSKKKRKSGSRKKK